MVPISIYFMPALRCSAWRIFDNGIDPDPSSPRPWFAEKIKEGTLWVATLHLGFVCLHAIFDRLPALHRLLFILKNNLSLRFSFRFAKSRWIESIWRSRRVLARLPIVRTISTPMTPCLSTENIHEDLQVYYQSNKPWVQKDIHPNQPWVRRRELTKKPKIEASSTTTSPKNADSKELLGISLPRKLTS